ncbi:hypothetical protein TRFO_08750 [Tritrichomonas foetus]|uniref:Uncharacterized protein n=1 Tax=Tritrichomonas foetus TaxID=1144522 RepID=A0A1J4JHV0_9EUKA|nr:hypothetical protein TRFO_08750 [Tritrichomonas foetus]|eukprot:OHS98738.1 hypothetical protein TRFO_08750 [Tritrichomonas foetus]
MMKAFFLFKYFNKSNHGILMLNLTLLSLTSLSQYTLSPLTPSRYSNIQLSNLRFSSSFSSLFFSRTNCFSASMLSSTFVNFLSPVIFCSSENSKPNNQNPFFNSFYGQPHIYSSERPLNVCYCKFLNCRNFKQHGGAISMNGIKTNVNISYSLFESCLSYKDGGALFIQFALNATYNYLFFTNCQSASRGQSIHSHLSGRQTTNYTSVTFSGLERSLLSSESISFVQGIQSHRYLNTSYNQGMKGASSSFFSTVSQKFSLSFFTAFNNTCELGRNFAILSNNPSTIEYGQIFLNSGGDLGVLYLGDTNWICEKISFSDNDNYPCLICGNGNQALFSHCFFDSYVISFSNILINEESNLLDCLFLNFNCDKENNPNKPQNHHKDTPKNYKDTPKNHKDTPKNHKDTPKNHKEKANSKKNVRKKNVETYKSTDEFITSVPPTEYTKNAEKLCIDVKYGEDYMKPISLDPKLMNYPFMTNSEKEPVDKFQKLRLDEVFDDPEVSLMNEAYVSFLIPLFFIVCFVWIRRRFTSLKDSSSFMAQDHGRIRSRAVQI